MPSPNSFAERVAHQLARRFPVRQIDIAPERPIVSFSFDDVPVSALVNGAAILERHGVHGTFYAAGAVAGGELDGQPILGEADYRALAARGHEIGHHTFSHRTAWAMGRNYATDLDRNDAFLAPINAVAARNFAYPYGRASLWTRGQIGRRFRSARGVETGINRNDTDLDLLRAVGIEGHMAAGDVLTFIDDVAAHPGWLIYLTHDVQERPSRFGTTPAILETLVRHALARGCEVLSVDEALDRLGVGTGTTG